MSTVRSCPVCDQNSGDCLFAVSYSGIAGHDLPEEYRVTACRSCGMVFDDVDAEEEMFRQHYLRQDKYLQSGSSGAGADHVFDRSRFIVLKNLLEQWVTDKAADVLDVGCAQGGLLKVLRANGYRNLHGLDLSPGCIAALSREPGIQAYCRLPPDLRFKVIIVSNVLEHIFDVPAFMEKVDQRLDPDGVLLIEVPDAMSYDRLFRGPFVAFDMEHINHWDKAHLISLAGRYGLLCEWIGVTDFEVAPQRYSGQLIGVFRRGRTMELSPDEQLRQEMERYIEHSRLAENSRGRITFQPGEKIYIWGIGAHAKRLFQEGCFEHLNICGLLDRSDGMKGTSIYGHTVFHPDILALHNEPDCTVIVTTAMYKFEVMDALHQMNWRGRIVDFC